jgi:hypothetical protein
VKGRLFECIDVLIDIEPPADAGADWKPKEDPLAAMKKGMKEATKIQQSCGAAFAVLASYGGKGDAGALEMTAHFYDYADIGLTDEQMDDCLKEEVRWNALSRESPEWQKAKREYDRRKLRGLAEKLGQDPQE